MTTQTIDLLAKFAGPIATVAASVTTAIVAIIFGVTQARSARRQLEIANDKLALDLFVRRFEVYQRIRGPIGRITTSGASNNKVENDLIEAIDSARLLFGQEMRAYLNEIYQHLIDLDYCNKALKDPNLAANERGSIASSRTSHFQVIASFYQDIDDRFGPYLTATHKFTGRKAAG